MAEVDEKYPVRFPYAPDSTGNLLPTQALQIQPDKNITTRASNVEGILYPWLPPDYTNGVMSFDTHFQDYDIENPAVVLQEALEEALGELWKRFLDSIWAEVAMVSPPRGDGCGC